MENAVEILQIEIHGMYLKSAPGAQVIGRWNDINSNSLMTKIWIDVITSLKRLTMKIK